MDTLSAVLLVIRAAFAWIGLTASVVLHLRRRRNGSTLVASAEGMGLRARPGRPRFHRNQTAARPRTVSDEDRAAAPHTTPDNH